MAHTPGPWRQPSPHSSEIRSPDGRHLVAEFFTRPTDDDARLIAAAPELLRELRGARCPRPCNDRPDEFEVGQCVDAAECGCSLGAAVQKAEGKP